MNPISLTDFHLITSTHGSEKGQTYFDAQESLVHYIFPDRIEFYTNFLDHRSYQVSFQQENIFVKKSRLDNYKLHLNATLIEDPMDEEDWEELEQLCGQMVHDLVKAPVVSKQDVRMELKELFSCFFTETEASVFAQKLPKKKKIDLQWIWQQIELALEKAHMLAAFEWKEWAEIGVMEVNKLGTIQQVGFEVPYPNKEELHHVTHAFDWERSILSYFNTYLHAFDLTLLAIGTHFDEYQTFASVPNGNLPKVLEKLEKLGLVFK